MALNPLKAALAYILAPTILMNCSSMDKSQSTPKVDRDDLAYQYLEDLQYGYREGQPYFPTDAERKEFCEEFALIFKSSRMPGGAEVLEKLTLPNGSFNCDYLAQEMLSLAPTEFSDPRFAFISHYLGIQIAGAANSLGMKLTSPPIVDSVPLPLLNAKVIEVPGSSRRLVLLNREVFRLPFEMSRAIAQSLAPTRAQNGYMAISTDRNAIAAQLDAKPEILQRYNHAILRYLGLAPTNGHIFGQDLNLNDDARTSLYILHYSLTEAIELFIVGHEFAHQILGHRVPPRGAAANRKKLGRTPGSQAESASYSWAQELEADTYGFLLMSAALTPSGAEPDASSYKFPFTISGPRLFFSFLTSVQQASSIIDKGAPPPDPTEEELALAIAAVSEMKLLSPPDSTPKSDSATSTLLLRHDTHPPFWLRSLLVQTLEKELLAQFNGSRDLVGLADAFQSAQSILDERSAATFSQLHLTIKGGSESE